MAIKVTEEWEGQSISLSATDDLLGVIGDDDANFIVTVEGNFTTLEAKELAINAPEIPNIYEPHPFNPFKFVKNIRGVTFKGPKIFLVTVHYEALIDPTSLPADIRWTKVGSNEPLEVDANGVPVLNSADQPFDPPPTDIQDDLLRRYMINRETFNHLLIAPALGAVNSDTFIGFPPGTCKIVDFSATRLRTGAAFYFKILNIVQVRAKGWRKEIPDQGTREKIGTKLVAFANGDGTFTERLVTEYRAITETLVDENDDEIQVQVTEPVNLDGAGQILAFGEQPQFRLIDAKPSIPFNTLGIA